MTEKKEVKGFIFNIQKCSIHDGEGIRTLVFFKGCPMRCKWCANPESNEYHADITTKHEFCIGCGVCKEVCPAEAIYNDAAGRFVIDREKCTHCGKCTETCYAKSKNLVGEYKTVDELFKIIERDRRYYDRSGGGVTFSGGEVLSQPEFLNALVKKCYENGISADIETCGYGDVDRIMESVPMLDTIYHDLKHIDPVRHKELTGKSNELILSNISKLAQAARKMIVRIPVIPGYNDEADNLKGIAEFVTTLPAVKEVELLAYHNLGMNKFKLLDMEYELEEVETPSADTMITYVKMMNEILEPSGKRCFYEVDGNKVW